MQLELKIIIAIIIVGILALLGFVTWTALNSPILKSESASSVNNETTEPTFAATVEALHSNPDSNFARGYQAELRGDTIGAQTLYNTALSEGYPPTETAHIKYRLARVLEDTDPVAAIRTFKEIIDEPTFPDNQKRYAAMSIPILITRKYYTDTRVLEEALSGQPYESFEGDSLKKTLDNFYKHSLAFGSNGIADFSVAQSLAEAVRDGAITDSVEVEKTKNDIAKLMQDGHAFMEEVRGDARNASLLPRIYRAQARANAVIAQIGDETAISNFDNLFIEAINQGLATKLDGAIRWDYFFYAYYTFGPTSFEKTQPHLDVILSNLNTYTGMRELFITEKNDRHGTKAKMVELANVNSSLKQALQQLGWTETDFAN